MAERGRRTPISTVQAEGPVMGHSVEPDRSLSDVRIRAKKLRERLDKEKTIDSKHRKGLRIV